MSQPSLPQAPAASAPARPVAKAAQDDGQASAGPIGAAVPSDLAENLGISRGARWRRRAWRALRYVAVAAVIALIVGAILRARRPPPPPTYVWGAVSRGDLTVTVTPTGRVEAATTVEVGAEVSGRIMTVTVEDNAAVTRGQVLAEIDREQLDATYQQQRAQLASARASVLQARASLREQQQLSARTAELAAKRLVTEQHVEANAAALARADAAYQVAQANAELAVAALSASRSRLDKATVRSPIDGVVLARLIEPGQTVTAGFTTPVLFKVAADLTHMTLRVDIDEADVGRVHVGDVATFTVDAYPGRTFPSRLRSLRNEPKIAQSVVTYEAELAVDNLDLALRPGMTATATIVTEVRRQALLVPNAALRFVPAGAAEAGAATAGAAKAGGAAQGPQGQGEAALDGTAGRVWIPRQEAAGSGPATLRAVAVQVGVSDGERTELRGAELRDGAKVAVDVAGLDDASARSSGLKGLP